jgi:hypothetical protein
MSQWKEHFQDCTNRGDTEMKIKLSLIGLAVVIQFAIINPAPAELIVDTGAGTSPSGWSISYGSFPGLGDQWQYLAAQFPLSQPATITGVQGWIATIDAGNADFLIYANGANNLPGTLLYQNTLHLDKTYDSNPPYPLNAGWYGPSGLTWNLAAGSYWLAFQSKDHLFYGAMPKNSPNPLVREAVWGKDTVADPAYNPGWLPYDLNLGVRIYGDVSAVPEPESYAMLLAGLGVIGFIARRRMKNPG